MWRLGVTGRRTYVGRVWHIPYDNIEASVVVPTFRNLKGPFETLRAAAEAIEAEWMKLLRQTRPVRRAGRKVRKAERREKRRG